MIVLWLHRPLTKERQICTRTPSYYGAGVLAFLISSRTATDRKSPCHTYFQGILLLKVRITMTPRRSERVEIITVMRFVYLRLFKLSKSANLTNR